MTSQFFANLAVILSIGVIASTWYSNKIKDKESQSLLTAKTNEIKELQKQYQDVLSGKAEEIQALQGQVIYLQGVGLDKMEHQINTLTGGNSFPLIYLSPESEETPHIYSGTLFIVGNYPLKNLSIKITTTHNEKSQNFNDIPIVNSIRQMTPTPIGKGGMVDLSVDPNAKILIRFIADNGTWIQRIQFRKDNEKGFQFKTEVLADQQPNVPPLVKTKFGEGVPIGSFENFRSTQYSQAKQ